MTPLKTTATSAFLPRMGTITLPWNAGRTLCIDAADIQEFWLSGASAAKDVYCLEISFRDQRSNYRWADTINQTVFQDMYHRARNGENVDYRTFPNAILSADDPEESSDKKSSASAPDHTPL